MIPPLSPAFSTNRQRWTATALLMIVLLFPFGVGALLKNHRERAYQAIPESAGPYREFARAIEGTGVEYDIVFVGASLLWTAIDPAIVEDDLSRAIGRPARVLMLGSNWPSRDLPYALIRDLLRKNRVKLVIADYPETAKDGPHEMGRFYSDPIGDRVALRGLALKYRLAVYSVAWLGTLRTALAGVRPPTWKEIPSDPSNTAFENRAIELGGRVDHLGFQYNSKSAILIPWSPFEIPPVHVPADDMIFSPSTVVVASPNPNFDFPGRDLTPFEDQFHRRLRDLVSGQGGRLAWIELTKFTDAENGTVAVARASDSDSHPPVPVIGIPGRKFLAGLPETDMQRMYNDRRHFNRNGNLRFTRTIAPAITALYLKLNPKSETSERRSGESK